MRILVLHATSKDVNSRHARHRIGHEIIEYPRGGSAFE